jgi:hypothetical protein
VAGLTASNLLTLAIVLALPVLAVPALVRGSVNRTLLEASIGGLGLFVVLFFLGALLLAFDRPLQRVGRVLQGVRNRLRRSAPHVRDLPARLLRERERILTTLGEHWKAALAAGIGRWIFDYATLLAALAAVGSTPRPGLVLLAFCTAQLLAQLPFTPRRPRLRRGRPNGHAHACRRLRFGRGPRHIRVPAAQLLAAATAGPDRGDSASQALSRRGQHRGRLTGQR